MGRLVDIDDVIKAVDKHTKDESEIVLDNDITCILEEVPTAYDVEKVVEKVKKLDLEGISMIEDGKHELVRKNEVISLIQTNGVCNGRQKSCAYCYKKDCPLSTEKTLADKWSDAVRKGGGE